MNRSDSSEAKQIDYKDCPQGVDKLPPICRPFELEPKKTALIVIDTQYADAHPDYGLGPYIREKSPEAFSYYYGRIANLVVPNQRKLLELFRNNGMKVIYITVGSTVRDLSDLSPGRREREKSLDGWHWMSQVGSYEHGILKEIVPLEGELVINKTTLSVFLSTNIEKILRYNAIEYLVLTGLVACGCVLGAGSNGADLGFKTVIVEDAIAGYSQENHDAAMRIFSFLFGRVETTDRICVELTRKLTKA